MPDNTNPRTANASNGAAMIGMSRRNNATAQNVSGVVIHALYGLFKVGSLILKITTPKTVRKKKCPGGHDSKIDEGAETTPQQYEGNCDTCLQEHGI